MMFNFFVPSRKDVQVDNNFNGILLNPRKIYNINEITLILIPDCIDFSEKIRSRLSSLCVTKNMIDEVEDTKEFYSKSSLSSSTIYAHSHYYNRSKVSKENFRRYSTLTGNQLHFNMPDSDCALDVIDGTTIKEYRYVKSSHICDRIFLKYISNKIYRVIIQSNKLANDLDEFLKIASQLVQSIDVIKSDFQLPFQYLCSREGYYARSIVDVINNRIFMCCHRKLTKAEIISINRILHRIPYIYYNCNSSLSISKNGYNCCQLICYHQKKHKIMSLSLISPNSTTLQQYSWDNMPNIKTASKNIKSTSTLKKKCYQPFYYFERDSPIKEHEKSFDFSKFLTNLSISWTKIFNIDCLIGNGNFSSVYKASKKNSKFKKFFALKIIEHNTLCMNKEIIHRELLILHMLKNSKNSSKNNVIQLLEVYMDKIGGLGIVLEYADKGDLYNYVTMALEHDTRKSDECATLSEYFCANIIHQILKAINYIHNNYIIHRDMKLENILLFTNRDNKNNIPIAKISDFGLSIQVDPNKIINKNKLISGICGTPYYIAPEMLLDESYGYPVDIWAIGIMLFIMLVGYPPFFSQNDDQDEILQSIVNGEINVDDDYLSKISPQANVFLCCLLCCDPDLRATADEALDNNWLKDHIL